MLAASMRYAGAIRLDHVLGLNRIYVIPEGFSAAEGAYLQFPLEKMLAVVANESHRHQCIVIGEDLGTVPDVLRAKLGEWGIWSYRVMLFERTADGQFRKPSDYPRNALVCFSTHDLPTFSGWVNSHDLTIKQALGLDPGESRQDRETALEALKSALAESGEIDYLAVVRFLAKTPSRLLYIPLEDVLALQDQTNLPGTVNEHPNWRHRIPTPLEGLADHSRLRRIAAIGRERGDGQN
jgi:4-alpha-glucanotransferase